jgi:hypothetical protein
MKATRTIDPIMRRKEAGYRRPFRFAIGGIGKQYPPN